MATFPIFNRFKLSAAAFPDRSKTMNRSSHSPWFRLARHCAVAAFALAGVTAAHAQTALADQPLDVPPGVPGNLLLSLSVEYPTATSIANSQNYSTTQEFLGYFDPTKCYSYQFDPASLVVSGGTTPYRANTDMNNYFVPAAAASATFTCDGTKWSGNFLNWATMQTIDPFRWALTGGFRIIDTTSLTVLEKAWASGQGGTGETPNRGSIPVTPGSVTPFTTWSSMQLRLWGLGNRLEFTGGGTGFNGSNGDTADTPYNPAAAVATNIVYSVKARVQVCKAGLLEANCTQYASDAKPEGLIQQYNTKIRYGAMGYLNDSSILRDAGVLRAPIDYVGPTVPSVTGGASTVNTKTEWDPNTGIFIANPDTADTATTNSNTCANSSGTTVPCATHSGVINYLNNFGEAAQSYKTYDPVSELYYASQRYFRGLGNVPEWSNLPQGGTGNAQNAFVMVDDFPVITNWVDPILYACQQNFILGIGDVNAHAGGNVSGPPAVVNTVYNPGGAPVTSLPQHNGGDEPAIPALVASDSTVDSVGATNFVGKAEGLGNTLGQQNVPWCCGDDDTFFMAGLAYDAHVKDMRPGQFLVNNIDTSTGNKVAIQTLSTYWLDVQEYQNYYIHSQFWLATKYGGFPVKQGYTPYVLPPSPASASSLSDLGNWASNVNAALGSAPGALGDSTQPNGTGAAMPNNYFGAGNAAAMVAGLNAAFGSIAASIGETTTPFGISSPNLSTNGSASYAAGFNSQNWSGNLIASATTFDAQGNPSSTKVWAVSGNASNPSLPDLYDAQLGPTVIAGVTYQGWNTSHNVATWNGTQGIPFRIAAGAFAANAPQLASFAHITGIAAVNQSVQNYLNYIRGDQSNEAPGGAGYRARTNLLGDIVNSKAQAVGPPAEPYSDSLDPGYGAFVAAHSARPTVVYVGANDGMMHAFNGTVTISPPGGSPPGGTEMFAYVPSFLYNGPTATPAINGLASLGTPNFTHHMLVDSTPGAFDIDLARTGGNVNAAVSNWATYLIGGLGKGGMGYYAIDVTNPLGLSNEASLAGAVKWEFTQPTMGYSYGIPIVVQTPKYGWVVVLTSGYNNGAAPGAGHGYFYFVNPATGILLETVQTPADGGTAAAPSGLAQVSAFGFTESGVADSVYAGDLLGNVWRIDLTGGVGSPAYTALKVAHVVGPSGAQPITTQIQVAADPSTSVRYMLFGTGELLGLPDYTTATIQSFYAIIDGTSAAFATAATLPATVTFPITRANLVANTNILAGVTLTPSQPQGWYLDFPTTVNQNGVTVSYRENVAAAAAQGIVLFAANAPNADVCNPTGTNLLYATNFRSGASVLLDSGSNVIASEVVPGGMINELAIVEIQQANGTPGGLQGIAGTATSVKSISLNNSSGGTIQRLNWREVPSAD
jgi:type IV pilus assembly protein PilY1